MLYLSQAIGRPARRHRRADRQGRRPHRRRRRPLSARHRPGRRDRPAAHLPALVARRAVRRDGRPARRRDHRHHAFPAATRRDPAADRPARQADRRHRRTARSCASTTCAWTTSMVGSTCRGRCRRGGAAAPARHRGGLSDTGPTCGCRRPSATSTGRTSIRSRQHRLDPPARAAGLTELHRPTSRRSSTSSPRATGRVSWPPSTTRRSPTPSRRWSPDTVEVLESLARARGRHPRGDVARRRGRPRGGPRRRDARAAGADGEGRGRGARRPRCPEDTAGGMMTTEFVAVPADLTAAATIDRLRELEPDAETIYYVYVVDAGAASSGSVAARPHRRPPSTPIGEVMIDEPVVVDVWPTGRRGSRRALQPAGRAGRRRRPAAGRDRHRRRRDRHDPAGQLAPSRVERRSGARVDRCAPSSGRSPGARRLAAGRPAPARTLPGSARSVAFLAVMGRG